MIRRVDRGDYHTCLEVVPTEVECTLAVATIHALDDRWIPQAEQSAGFFTFGAASYLDTDAEYRRIAAGSTV
jgi:hypothetical protein